MDLDAGLTFANLPPELDLRLDNFYSSGSNKRCSYEVQQAGKKRQVPDRRRWWSGPINEFEDHRQSFHIGWAQPHGWAHRRVTRSKGPASVVVGKLDDEDYPVLTMGQAAELLGVQQAFLRSLDAAKVLQPQRSRGGHRRYSRRQLVLAARMRTLFDEGLSLEAAHRIVQLEDQLETARRRIAELEAHQDECDAIGSRSPCRR